DSRYKRAMVASPRLGDSPAVFVGREAELEQLTQLFSRPHPDRSVLACIAGPGGIGKTSLARAASTHLASFFPDGVFWVSLRNNYAGPAEVARSVLSQTLNRSRKSNRTSLDRQELEVLRD